MAVPHADRAPVAADRPDLPDQRAPHGLARAVADRDRHRLQRPGSRGVGPRIAHGWAVRLARSQARADPRGSRRPRLVRSPLLRPIAPDVRGRGRPAGRLPRARQRAPRGVVRRRHACRRPRMPGSRPVSRRAARCSAWRSPGARCCRARSSRSTRSAGSIRSRCRSSSRSRSTCSTSEPDLGSCRRSGPRRASRRSPTRCGPSRASSARDSVCSGRHAFSSRSWPSRPCGGSPWSPSRRSFPCASRRSCRTPTLPRHCWDPSAPRPGSPRRPAQP